MTEFLRQRIGEHTPTADEVRTRYIPLIEKMLMGEWTDKARR